MRSEPNIAVYNIGQSVNADAFAPCTNIERKGEITLVFVFCKKISARKSSFQKPKKFITESVMIAGFPKGTIIFKNV